jgi:phage host-nuclease inhibitor protein Gam
VPNLGCFTQNTEGDTQAETLRIVTASDSLMAVYFPKVKDFGISVKMMMTWIEAYSTAHIEACINDFLEKVKKGKLKTTEPMQQGGYLRALIDQMSLMTTDKAIITAHLCKCGFSRFRCENRPSQYFQFKNTSSTKNHPLSPFPGCQVGSF